jgi:hypothetical protein
MKVKRKFILLVGIKTTETFWPVVYMPAIRKVVAGRSRVQG